MRSHLKLGKIFGIEIGLHISWFIIAYLIVISVAQSYHAVDPRWGPGLIWGLSIATALLFFVTLLMHEMAHSLVARSQGMPVRAITLFALGGVSQIEGESPNAKTEFWMALAGPLTSFVIGVICLAVARGLKSPTPGPPLPGLALLVWLGYINIGIGVFNLVPGYPLDGGRVLRAAIWGWTKNARLATRWAANIGHWIGLLLIFYGIFRIFTGAGFNGLWIAFIGWFLSEAAQGSVAQQEMGNLLKGIRVQDIMLRDYPIVSGDMDIDSFVRQNMLRTGQRFYVVEEDGRTEGLITPHEIKQVDHEKWSGTPLHSVMRPMHELHAVSPDTPVQQAFAVMMREDVNQLPVVSDHHVEGVLSRGRVLQLLRSREELG